MATTAKATTKKTTAKKTTAAKAPTTTKSVRAGAPNRPTRLNMAYLDQRLDFVEEELAKRFADYPALVPQKEEESVDANSILESAKELVAAAKKVTNRGRIKVEEENDDDVESASNDDDDDLIDISL